MKQFMNWEKISKIFVVVSLLLNLVLTMIILSSLENIEASLDTFTNNSSLHGDNGRYNSFQQNDRTYIYDTRTGEVK
jgi:regulatory protein YycI of two-component signal transduction system YycFG